MLFGEEKLEKEVKDKILLFFFKVRQESRFLRNETDSQTKWDQYSNDVRLADRVDQIRKWKEILERTLGQLDQEIADLSEAKELTEQALEAKNLPTDVAIECLTLREGRRNIDVVQDEPENQLHKVSYRESIYEYFFMFLMSHAGSQGSALISGFSSMK